MNVFLRDYQNDAIDSIRQLYAAGHMAPLLVLPTGSGKTVIFCDIAERVSIRNKRVYILVHRAELLNQTSEHLDKLGVDHGKIAPGYTMTSDLVQVSSVQTLVRRLDKLPNPDLLIIDEAHHAVAKSWSKIISNWQGVRLLGVTATPLRLDGKGLGKHVGGCFDSLITGPSVKELTSQGYLTPSIIYAPPSGFNTIGIKTIAGDYDKKETTVRIDKPVITGCAIEHYKKHCPDFPAIAFCASIKHATHVAEQFNQAGIPSMSIDGTLSDKQRKHRIQSLGNGTIKVLTSCEIISEGTDIPVVSTAILLRPTKSLAIFLQQCGRTLRPAPQIGKTHSVILDHVGNCLRHGMVDDSREWSLDGQKKKKGNKNEEVSAAVRQCAGCYAVYPVYLPKCPQCGMEYNTIERKIKEVAGELIQVSSFDIAKHQKQKRVEVGKAQSLEELEAIGKQRGYKNGWAFRLYNIRKQRRVHA